MPCNSRTASRKAVGMAPGDPALQRPKICQTLLAASGSAATIQMIRFIRITPQGSSFRALPKTLEPLPNLETVRMFGLSMTEILLLLFLGVLLFGKRLPEVGRQVGKTLM